MIYLENILILIDTQLSIILDELKFYDENNECIEIDDTDDDEHIVVIVQILDECTLDELIIDIFDEIDEIEIITEYVLDVDYSVFILNDDNDDNKLEIIDIDELDMHLDDDEVLDEDEGIDEFL